MAYDGADGVFVIWVPADGHYHWVGSSAGCGLGLGLGIWDGMRVVGLGLGLGLVLRRCRRCVIVTYLFAH